MARFKRTPEQVSAARRAAVMKRWHPASADAAAAPPSGKPADGKSEEGKLPGYCAYDDVVPKPQNYNDCLAREKVLLAEKENRQKEVDLEIRTGKIFTAESVIKRDEKWNALAAAEINKAERLSDQIPGLTIEQRGAFLAAYRVWRDEFAKALSRPPE